MNDPDPIDRFAASARSAGASTIVVAWQQEWDLTRQHGFGPVSRVRLVAYSGGTMLAEDLPGEAHNREVVAARLRAAGFAVEFRRRNQA
jgi:hypothetical protein